MMRPAAVILLLSLSTLTTLAWDTAHVTGTFYCSARPDDWIPTGTHFRFWDKGRVFDNILLETNLSQRNQTIDVILSNGIFGMRPYMTIVHFCEPHDDPVVHTRALKLGENRLGRLDLAALH